YRRHLAAVRPDAQALAYAVHRSSRLVNRRYVHRPLPPRGAAEGSTTCHSGTFCPVPGVVSKISLTGAPIGTSSRGVPGRCDRNKISSAPSSEMTAQLNG